MVQHGPIAPKLQRQVCATAMSKEARVQGSCYFLSHIFSYACGRLYSRTHAYPCCIPAVQCIGRSSCDREERTKLVPQLQILAETRAGYDHLLQHRKSRSESAAIIYNATCLKTEAQNAYTILIVH